MPSLTLSSFLLKPEETDFGTIPRIKRSIMAIHVESFFQVIRYNGRYLIRFVFIEEG